MTWEKERQSVKKNGYKKQEEDHRVWVKNKKRQYPIGKGYEIKSK